MSKLKITFFLPLCQFAVAAVLLAWGHKVSDPVKLDTLYVPTVHFVCMGINAPLLPARPLIGLVTATPVNHAPRSILGFGLDEILYLAAVFGLWYLVAIWFQTVRGRNESRLSRVVFSSRVWNVAVAVLGGLLLIVGIELLLPPDRFNNPLGSRVEATFIIAWACALLLAAGRTLLAASRQEQLGSSKTS